MFINNKNILEVKDKGLKFKKKIKALFFEIKILFKKVKLRKKAQNDWYNIPKGRFFNSFLTAKTYTFNLSFTLYNYLAVSHI